MCEGAFNTLNLDDVSHTTHALNFLKSNPAAQALYEYVLSQNDLGKPFSPNLAELIAENLEAIDYEATLKALFGNTSYADYIFSIQMGAGKTWLMAMFVYLNLYFAVNEPANKVFAHNFIVVAPAGLKSSIIPSLKDMKEFDPEFILPKDEAMRLKRMVIYEVLEDSNSSKGSNIVKNPNAVKIQSHIPFHDLMGLVVITNVEKLYDKLDKSDKFDDKRFDYLPEDEKKQWLEVKLANELREIIGKLPGLCIMVDEVQHAKTEGLQIVKVINKWAKHSDLNSILCFSGTPYFSSPDTIKVSDTLKLKLEMFGNVETYYPLAKAVGNFLKRPRVRYSSVSSEDIIRNGITEFLVRYQDTVYPEVGSAKLAIYCDLINRLEEEVYPLVCSICREHGLDPEEAVLRYYGSTSKSKYKCPTGAQADFRALDTVFSKHRIVLLAQIGKEGGTARASQA
ncbi:MAG: DEAD/DEAH box helicase family protein [Prevotella sp.]|nr:DEAD/DEAH box helicase family protein [Prevotella sp.]